MGENSKLIVISAINLSEGGTLTILKNCLNYLSSFVENNNYKVLALVYDRVNCYYDNIEYIEIKKAKYNWCKRIYIEYFYFHHFSKKRNIYLWFSLHDITPRVSAQKRVVYCHNPTPFYKPKIHEVKFSFKLFLFSSFYKYLYKININKNNFIIVQQSWIKDCFINMYKLKKDKVIVAYPHSEIKQLRSYSSTDYSKIIFFYPSLPRPFKNFEVICEAVRLLKKRKITNFQVLLTVDGNENKYAKWLYKTYSHLKNIKFTGHLTLEEVHEIYSYASCLIFPSSLETWGLPISEFCPYNKPMIIADLPYAKETASSAKLVSFFDPLNAEQLAEKMECVIKGNIKIFKEVPASQLDEPFTHSWKEIFDMIL